MLYIVRLSIGIGTGISWVIMENTVFTVIPLWLNLSEKQMNWKYTAKNKGQNRCHPSCSPHSEIAIVCLSFLCFLLIIYTKQILFKHFLASPVNRIEPPSHSPVCVNYAGAPLPLMWSSYVFFQVSHGGMFPSTCRCSNPLIKWELVQSSSYCLLGDFPVPYPH